jgi:hypothetical protein
MSVAARVSQELGVKLGQEVFTEYLSWCYSVFEFLSFLLVLVKSVEVRWGGLLWVLSLTVPAGHVL